MHIHWHWRVRDDRMYSYKECRCGHRKAVRTAPLNGFGYSPMNVKWVNNPGMTWEESAQLPKIGPKGHS